MRISAKGEYAIKAMVDLPLHDGQDLQPIQDIAARQAIPQRYLEQVLLQLKRSGFLVSRLCSSGGYRLSRPPDQITVGSVLRAVEGSLAGIEPPRRIPVSPSSPARSSPSQPSWPAALSIAYSPETE